MGTQFVWIMTQYLWTSCLLFKLSFNPFRLTLRKLFEENPLAEKTLCSKNLSLQVYSLL